jgi:hypothetical protein
LPQGAQIGLAEQVALLVGDRPAPDDDACFGHGGIDSQPGQDAYAVGVDQDAGSVRPPAGVALDHLHLDAALLQRCGKGEAGQACAHDQDISCCCHAGDLGGTVSRGLYQFVGISGPGT